MNENNNLNLNNDEKVTKKNNNKVLYVIIGILVVAIIGCITIVMNKPKEEKENKPEEEIVEKEEINNENESYDNNLTTDENDDITIKDETEDEEEIEENEKIEKFVNPNAKYEYLVDRLYSNLCYNADVFSNNFNINKLDNKYVLQVALAELANSKDIDMETITISKENEYYEALSQSGELGKNNTIKGYSSEQVLNMVKKVFGKNISVKKESVMFYLYIKESDAFIRNNGVGCSALDGKIQETISVSNKGNQLDITVAVGYFNKVDSKLYDLNKNFITSYEVNDNYEYVINGITVEEYIYNNANKFNQYKFTFTLEDGNYIFTGLEKLK